MRRRLYEPMPDRIRQLEPKKRREISKTVRRGQQVEQRRDAKPAIALAEWMERQARTSYLELLSTPVVMIAIVALFGIGIWSFGSIVPAIANVVPFLAIMYLIRVAAWFLFRRAPEAKQANLELLRRRKRR